MPLPGWGEAQSGSCMQKSRISLGSIGATNDQSTPDAPGILRKAAVAAQLKNTVSTNAIAALAIAGRS